MWSNALPMDRDNDHSAEPKDWITPEDIGFFFTGVPHIIHFSRHHMKRKGDNSSRQRFHVIFLIDPTTSEQEYAKLFRSTPLREGRRTGCRRRSKPN